MHVALIYPPTCDPTAPYLSLPTLTAYLRRAGVTVTQIDANLEAWLSMLTEEHLSALRDRIEAKLTALEEKRSLSHAEQLAYAALWAVRADAQAAPGAIARALSVFRDRARFNDVAAYEQAVATVDAAQRVVGAAHHPLSVDFVAYRTPFSLLTAEEIAHDASAERDPFHLVFEQIADRLAASGARLVGVSVAFPGQIQPAYALAAVLRARLPGVHVTVGGPALTQMLQRLSGETLTRALGPFMSAVVGEGEVALLEMARAIDEGRDPCPGGPIVRGTQIEDMSQLPPPDFDGLPLGRYLAPELVLPYDPTRGCYWGVCTFCHYGLAEVGTARYRERPEAVVLDHLEALQKAHGARIFYFSQDVFSPRIATRIARGIKARGLSIRWGTDMRPERALSPERCRELYEGGALSTSLGIESAAPRVLSLIDKGIPAADVRKAVQNLSQAGVAVEAMCFSDFPTESYREALETVGFVDDLKDDLSLFILGRFDLTHGSLVAQKPGEFGIGEVWHVAGDEFKTGLFFAERQRAKTPEQQARLEGKIEKLSSHWRLHRYPWAGALSTAHSMITYLERGKAAFRVGAPPTPPIEGARPVAGEASFDVVAITSVSAEREAAIWAKLVGELRHVSRERYEQEASKLPRARPAPGRYRVSVGGDLEAIAAEPRGSKRKGPTRGRRPSHSPNATKG